MTNPIFKCDDRLKVRNNEPEVSKALWMLREDWEEAASTWSPSWLRPFGAHVYPSPSSPSRDEQVRARQVSKRGVLHCFLTTLLKRGTHGAFAFPKNDGKQTHVHQMLIMKRLYSALQCIYFFFPEFTPVVSRGLFLKLSGNKSQSYPT